MQNIWFLTLKQLPSGRRGSGGQGDGRLVGETIAASLSSLSTCSGWLSWLVASSKMVHIQKRLDPLEMTGDASHPFLDTNCTKLLDNAWIKYVSWSEVVPAWNHGSREHEAVPFWTNKRLTSQTAACVCLYSWWTKPCTSSREKCRKLYCLNRPELCRVFWTHHLWTLFEWTLQWRSSWCFRKGVFERSSHFKASRTLIIERDWGSKTIVQVAYLHLICIQIIRSFAFH